ncbi:MAG: tetratricopeptide repeat protein [Arenimonas sp.]
MTGLVDRLRQRKLAQWAIAYAAGAWLLLQVLGLAADSYEWPRLVMRLAIGVVVIGFLVTLVLAWYHGERGQQKVGGTELLLLALLLTMGGAIVWRAEQRREPDAADVPAVSATNATTDRSIAVLPFDNLSRDPDNAYFVDGIQDEILTRLARISALKVISRTSTQQYAAKPGNLGDIARQLGVAHILEGSVQRAGGKMRVNVQLIEAATDAHLWAESYDRDTADLFAVQSEIAQAVADAMKARLLPAEAAGIARVPTTSAQAYDRFLQAEYFARRYHDTVVTDPVAAVREAEGFYHGAIAADPAFALANSRLGYLLASSWWRGHDRRPETLAAARDAVGRALALQPDLPEAHLAMGYIHYWGAREYVKALDEFALARAGLPNDVDVIGAMAYVHRRQGKLAQAIDELAQAELLAPRSTQLPRDRADTLGYVRRYAEAVAAADRALVIAPDNFEALAIRAQALQMAGDLDGASRSLAAIPADQDPQGSVSYVRHALALVMRDPARALAAVASASGWVLDSENNIPVPVALLRAQALQVQDDAAAARAAWLDAQRALDGAPPPSPLDEPGRESLRALIHAGLGEREAALEAARRATELMPMAKDSLDGPVFLTRRARTEAQVGELDAAFEHLRQALDAPAGWEVSAASLRTDPAWDRLRDDPRFAALLARAAAGR